MGKYGYNKQVSLLYQHLPVNASHKRVRGLFAKTSSSKDYFSDATMRVYNMAMNALLRYFDSVIAIAGFLFYNKNLVFPLWNRLVLVWRFLYISRRVECAHTNAEMIQIVRAILTLPTSINGVIVEAGAYKGGSTVKLSLVARAVGRKLVVFDSFKGIPSNTELLSNVGKKNVFVIPRGMFTGTLKEVKANVASYGAPEVCTYVRGWFDQTLPTFAEPIAGIFLDVDLASSERVCIKYLYPLLQSGGVLFSHDGHIDRVVEVYKDRKFWKKELHLAPPKVDGLGRSKLLYIKRN